MAKPQTLAMPMAVAVVMAPLLIILIAIPFASAAVSSIDLGSESLKIAVVNLKPGQSPISIALSPMSKRKSPSLVAFPSPHHRLLSEEAAAVQARSPHRVFSHLRDLLAKPLPYAQSYLNSLYLPFDILPDPSRGEAFRIRVEEKEEVSLFSIEELLAMVLGYGMGLAETHVKGKVRDAVIAVPVFYGQAERRGLVQAAELAGVNVLGLIHEHAGAALQYGIDKDFGNESRYVVFYDMGAGSTYAALVYFSAYNAKEFGKTVSVNQFQVKDVRWDSRLGGQDMEMRLVEHFADEFNSKLGNGVDVRKSPKAMAKLKKQVKRTKEILSANTMAPISVESLLDDIDFRSSITREKFEELCSDLWEKALFPLKEVIKHSGLKLEEIYAVELIGGATRVPKLQATLQEFLGRKDLDKHLDADEAIALGASLHAANISDGIKLNRKLGMIDGSPYGFLLEIVGADLVKDENTDMLLVPRMKKLGIKLFRSIKYNRDFEVSLSYESSSDLPPGASSTKFAEYSVLGLTEASEKYSTRNLSAPIKANLHFSLSKSGILSLDRAEAVIEISEWVEVPKKNETSETDNKVINATEKSTEVNSEDKTETLNLEDTVNSSNLTSDEQDPVVTTEKVLKKKTFRVPLQVVEKSTGPVAVLSKDAFSEAKTRLETLDKIDAERRKTAELKNNLEEYIYSMKEKMEENVELQKVSTEQERESFIEKLNEVQEWLYSDGEDASANEFKERLEMLKAIGDPIFFRLSELKARPLASENAKTYLAELQKIVSNWETNKPWLPKSRVDEVLKEAESLKSWLDDKEELQKKTSEFTAPVFTSDEVYDKFFKLQDKVASVNRIPKPKPKIEKPPKQENVSQENTDTSSSDSQDPTGSEQQKNSDGSATENTEPEVHDEL